MGEFAKPFNEMSVPRAVTLIRELVLSVHRVHESQRGHGRALAGRPFGDKHIRRPTLYVTHFMSQDTRGFVVRARQLSPRTGAADPGGVDRSIDEYPSGGCEFDSPEQCRGAICYA